MASENELAGDASPTANAEPMRFTATEAAAGMEVLASALPDKGKTETKRLTSTRRELKE